MYFCVQKNEGNTGTSWEWGVRRDKQQPDWARRIRWWGQLLENSSKWVVAAMVGLYVTERDETSCQIFFVARL